jgi:hypothetical protein
MSAPDDVLEWMRPALDEMKQDYHADPGKPWEERRETFLQQLGLQDASQHPTVQQFMERLDETPEDERNKVLGGDKLDSMAIELAQQHADGQGESGQQAGGQQESGQQAGGQQAGYDEQAWQAFLAENGPRWDGTEGSWDQFRQWFAYYAGQQGLGTPATALLDYLATQPTAERITTFAQYGVTITAPQAAAAQGTAEAGLTDEDLESLMEGAAAEQGGQEAAQAAGDEDAEEDTGSFAEDPLENPELADMSEEERVRVMSEALDGLDVS